MLFTAKGIGAFILRLKLPKILTVAAVQVVNTGFAVSSRHGIERGGPTRSLPFHQSVFKRKDMAMSQRNPLPTTKSPLRW